jgi:hypothetical protein
LGIKGAVFGRVAQYRFGGLGVHPFPAAVGCPTHGLACGT